MEKEQHSPPASKLKSTLTNKKTLTVIVIVALLLIGAGYYLSRTTDTLTAVSALVMLPDETPAIYSIDNPNLMKVTNNFFSKAEPGDKLLVFPQANQAIIYRPSLDILVNMGAINFDPNAKLGEQQTPAEAPK